MLPKPLSSYHYAIGLQPTNAQTTGMVYGPILAAEYNSSSASDFDERGEVDICGESFPVYSFNPSTPDKLIILFDKKQSIKLELELANAYRDCLQVKQSIIYNGEVYKLRLMLDCPNFMELIKAGGNIVNKSITGEFRFNCGHRTELKFVSL